MTYRVLLLVGFIALFSTRFNAPSISAQTISSSGDEQLKYVVYVSRHGVRSPTGKSTQYDVYSTASWPKWTVEPGYLTPHGFHLMELFGAYDRVQLAKDGLLQPAGCLEANRIKIYADSDQRTRETGRAISQGMFPDCNVPVQSLPEGTNDSLFHPDSVIAHRLNLSVVREAVAGRIGGEASNITQAYRSQIASLDNLLASCGTARSNDHKRVSLFDVPASLSSSTGDHLVDLKGPLFIASTLSENLLLEYTEGMATENVGWGCVNRENLQSLMELHSAATDFSQRTPEIARAQASNLLDRINRSIEQSVAGKPIVGAIGKPSDRVLFLVGHDTNIENIAGTLNLNWIIDGRRDDTPPGSALVFEVWKNSKSGDYTVGTYFTAQTLDEMRSSIQLDISSPPKRVPVFVPGCGGEKTSCPLAAFTKVIEKAIDQRATISR